MSTDMKKTSIIFLMLLSVTIAAAQQELRIPYSNKTVYGIISRPTPSSGTSKHKVAIISHGFNGSHQFGRDYFQTLNRLGYEVYTFDFPCGSIHSNTDSNTMNMSVLDEKECLKAIVRYFRKQKSTDKNNIVLIGESQGGLVSALAAADLKKQISALVLIYPAFCIPDNWNGRYPTVEAIPDTTHVWNVPLSRRFFLEIHDMNPFNIIDAYKGPVLIIHGDRDPIVPAGYSEKAKDTYRHARLEIIPGAGHGFNPQQRVLSNSLVERFLQDIH